MTNRYEGDIREWEGDHTDLYYTLIDMTGEGLIEIPDGDHKGQGRGDAAASYIGQSRWLKAVKHHVAERIRSKRTAQEDITALAIETFGVTPEAAAEFTEKARAAGLLHLNEPNAVEELKAHIIRVVRDAQVALGYQHESPQSDITRAREDEWFKAVDVIQGIDPNNVPKDPYLAH
jgi:hypothetical protein